MSVLQTTAVFLAIMALVGWINARALRLPTGVAMLCAGMIAAGLLFAAQTLIGPFWGFDSVRAEIGRLNFSETVLGYLLAFLLFSSGMQVDLGEFRRRRVAIWSLATLGVLVSTGLVGLGIWQVSKLVGEPLSLPWALVFGALISPTDPVAVMANVRSGELSKSLGAVLQGEALFNDGVGLVAFTAALDFALSGARPPALHMAGAILVEAAGGLALGFLGGRLVVRGMRAIDDYVIELTATLALATGAYALAHTLHLSGPVAAAAAGLVVGSDRAKMAMGEETERHVSGFWHVGDEVLNGLLFLLTGLQIFVVPIDLRELGLWAAGVVLVIAARLLVVLPWGAYFRFRRGERNPSLLLAWGGLRGAVSLALALSLPRTGPGAIVLATTFAVVSVSVVVQGLTFGPIARRLQPPESAEKRL